MVILLLYLIILDSVDLYYNFSYMHIVPLIITNMPCCNSLRVKFESPILPYVLNISYLFFLCVCVCLTLSIWNPYNFHLKCFLHSFSPMTPQYNSDPLLSVIYDIFLVQPRTINITSSSIGSDYIIVLSRNIFSSNVPTFSMSIGCHLSYEFLHYI